MKRANVDYRTMFTVLLLVAYPMSVLAGQDLFHDTTGFSMNQAVYALFMGFWGALASFSQEFAKGRVGSRWVRVLSKDTINSTLAAIISLMFCVYKEVHPALIGVICTVSGYGGVRTLNWMYCKFTSQADKVVG